MTGEILTGVATGVMQVASTAAMEVPSVATEVAQVAIPVVSPMAESALETGNALATVGTSVSSMGSHLVSVTDSAVSMVSETQAEMGTSLLAESVAESLPGMENGSTDAFVGQMEALLADGTDATSLLEGLGDGLLTGEDVVPTQTLVEEAERMADFSADQALDVFGQVDRQQIPSEMLEDPNFRADVANSLVEEAQQSQQKTVDPAQKEEMLQKSVERAKAKFGQKNESAKTSEQDEKELERFKRKAALEAVHNQMEAWRQSVDGDKRLSPEAKEIAKQKIDRVEKRMLLQTNMKWDGKSLLSMAVVGAMWLTE